MALFNWNSAFATDIAVIDDQHKKLIAFVNELHDAMRQRKAKEVIERLLGELAEYTVYHFSTEERAFDKYAYAGAAAHKRTHADFVAKVQDLIAKHKSGQLMLSIDLLEFLVSWVSNHILKDDRLYIPLLKDKVVD